VEDHSDTRDVLSRLLKSLGCSVTAVASVQEAIDVAERQSFDLLVSDIGLPDGSGMDVMKHMAARHSLQGIALSGYGQDEDLRRSRDAGFMTHLTKPVGLRALEDALRKVSGPE
jgi:CheY-like chemotaxis protein